MDRTRASIVLAGLLSGAGLLLPGPASAKPTRAPAPVEGMMIVWSGANGRERAEQQREGMQELVDLLGTYVEGGITPEVFESRKVEGLKPGFFVVSLGVCPEGEGAEILRLFEAIYPDVYAKPVKYRPTDELPAQTCPRLAIASEKGNSEPGRWTIAASESRLVGAARLAALVFSYSESTAGDFMREYAGVEALFVLTDPRKRTVTASATFRGPSDWTTLTGMTEAGTGYDLQLRFADPPCDPGGDDHFESYEQTVAVRVAKGAVSVREGKRRKIDEGVCGYEAEERMILGPHAEDGGD